MFLNTDADNAYREWCRLTGTAVDDSPDPFAVGNQADWRATAQLLADDDSLTDSANRPMSHKFYNHESVGRLVTLLLAGAFLYARGLPASPHESPQYSPPEAMAVVIATRGLVWKHEHAVDPHDVAITIGDVTHGPFYSASEMFDVLWEKNRAEDLFRHPYEAAYRRAAAKAIEEAGEPHLTKFRDLMFRQLTLNPDYADAIETLGGYGYIMVRCQNEAITVKSGNRPTRGHLQDEAAAFLKESLADPEFRSAYEDEAERHQLLDGLVKRRTALALTQSEISRRMHLQQPTVSEFENESSDPKISTLQRYARAVEAKLRVTIETNTPE